MQLSASLENYLETILDIYEEKQEIKATDIAKRSNVSKASVTEALRALAGKGLINYTPYENITLTSCGTDRAKKIMLKHKVLYDFLNGFLEIEKNEAMENACKIEHVISENVLNKFICFLEFNNINCVQKSEYIKDFHLFCKEKRKTS